MRNSKVFSVILICLVLTAILISNVAAQSAADSWKKFQTTILSFVSPVGFEDQWTGIVIGILAIIMLFAIVLDVSELALPFSTWVNYTIAGGLVIAAALLGLVRSIAGWGLTIGAYLVGGAGALAMIASAVLIVIVIIVLFFGNQTMAKWAAKARGNREIIEAEKKAYKDAAKIRGARVTESGAAGVTPS